MIPRADLLFSDVELRAAGAPLDVRVRGGVVVEIGTALRPEGERVADGAGGALLPGLHDHHLHVLASAAADDSVGCGGPEVRTRSDLARVLGSAVPRKGWIRAIGFDDAVVGDLDRQLLDEMRPDVPVRIQHRSGALWVLNSAAAEELELASASTEGVERDAAGRPTGRLWRLDRWLGERLGPGRTTPDLAAFGRRLAELGMTGVTDATPNLSPATAALLSESLPQHVTLLGDATGSAPWKIVVPDHALPDLEELSATIEAVRPRPVALHCVTRAAILLTLIALREVGAVPGDRIEHAAVCPPEATALVAELGVTVVTQPSLVALRSDDYLDRVEAGDVDALWPFASLLAAGVPVGCSSDAPYGDVDPWRSIAAAHDRRTPSGRTAGARERVTAAQALDGFLSPPDAPGGPPRTVAVGAPADLVLLDRPLEDALDATAARHVRLTVIEGSVVHDADRVAFA